MADRSVGTYGNLVDISDCPERELGRVSVNGSLVDLRGKAADKPLATVVTAGTTYWSVDTDPHGVAVEVSDGTNWMVI